SVLDRIRSRRATNVGISLDRRANNIEADRAYAAAFTAVGLDPSGTSVSEKIQGSAVAAALLAALDDWAVCAADDSRRAWILGVARQADANTDAWRNHARDPRFWTDRKTLMSLMQSASVKSERVQLLTVLAERLHSAGADSLSFLQRVQAAHPADFW